VKTNVAPLFSMILLRLVRQLLPDGWKRHEDDGKAPMQP
jgi:hypothetical protein